VLLALSFCSCALHRTASAWCGNKKRRTGFGGAALLFGGLPYCDATLPSEMSMLALNVPAVDAGDELLSELPPHAARPAPSTQRAKARLQVYAC
jgi:hypothetical protein